jgi:hypothetical protein
MEPPTVVSPFSTEPLLWQRQEGGAAVIPLPLARVS